MAENSPELFFKLTRSAVREKFLVTFFVNFKTFFVVFVVGRQAARGQPLTFRE